VRAGFWFISNDPLESGIPLSLFFYFDLWPIDKVGYTALKMDQPYISA
jgi:hypothetical protein